MDIFFFITSIVAIVVLVFLTTVGVYVFLIIQKVKKHCKRIKKICFFTSLQSQESVESIKDKIEEILKSRWVSSNESLQLHWGLFLQKLFKKRGKMKKDAPKE
jgi:hypothetical protein